MLLSFLLSHTPTLEKALCSKVTSPLTSISTPWFPWLQALLTDKHVPPTTGQEAHWLELSTKDHGRLASLKTHFSKSESHLSFYLPHKSWSFISQLALWLVIITMWQFSVCRCSVRYLSQMTNFLVNYNSRTGSSLSKMPAGSLTHWPPSSLSCVCVHTPWALGCIICLVLHPGYEPSSLSQCCN